MHCPFCQIVKGEKPEEVLHRTDRFCVFAPMTRAPGKLLIVPIQHCESLADLSFADLGQWLQEARELATRLGIGKFKMQINVGNEFQVRHVYMQFHFDQRAVQEELACHRSSRSTDGRTQQAPTGGRGRLPVTLRPRRTM